MADVTRGEGGENAVVRYLRETRSELAKVVWPTRQEAISLTIVVLIVTITMAMLLGGIDVLFNQVVRFVLETVQG